MNDQEIPQSQGGQAGPEPDPIRQLLDRLQESKLICEMMDMLDELNTKVSRLEGELRDLRLAQRGAGVLPAALPAPAPLVSRGSPRANRAVVRPTVITLRSEPRGTGAAEATVAAPASPLASAVIAAVATQPEVVPGVPGDDPALGKCAEPGCDRPVRSRGLCSAHYQRLRYRERKGEPPPAAVTTAPASTPAVVNPVFGAQRLPPVPLPRTAPASIARRGGGTKGVFAVLYDEKGRRVLAGLINQIRHNRRDLVARVNEVHQGMPGVPLEEEDVMRAVHYHKLGDALRKREGDVICRALTKQRGSLFKTAQAVKLELPALKARITELGLDEGVAHIRNQFRETILDHSSFQERLDLALTREKYLEDLGVEEEVDASLRRELDAQMARLAPGLGGEEAVAAIRTALALDEERTRRLLKRFGLVGGEPDATGPAAEGH